MLPEKLWNKKPNYAVYLRRGF